MNQDPATNATCRPKRCAVATVIVVALGLLAACGGDGGGNGDGAPAAASQGAVAMQLISFKPDTVTVDGGTTVTWTQKDPGVHTVTSGTVEQGGGGVTKVPDGRFDSGELATGKTFTFTFDQPGTYPYFCSVHPATMRGEVRVS